MRRAQTTRHQTRPSLTLGADDLGVLREGAEESIESALRRQLVEKERENDKLRSQVQSLQTQLAQRPPIERIQALERELNNVELLYQGTQRENKRVMAEKDSLKEREKLLERTLAKFAGENWQEHLDIAPSANTSFATRSGSLLHRSVNGRQIDTGSSEQVDVEATHAHLEQVRLLILGMEQRLLAREEVLNKTIERAETEGGRFEEMGRNVVSAKG